MKKLFKPACLLLYLLTVMVFFLIGLLYANWIEAGKNQGLAAAAIVLGYGAIFAIVALILSFFAAYHLRHKTIIRINLIFGTLVLAGFFLILFRVYERNKLRETETEPVEELKSTKPVESNCLLALANIAQQGEDISSNDLELGFFKPNFFDHPVLYFYGNPNFEKSVYDHSPTDSIVFTKREMGGFEILKAPPWLLPAHLKLDYDILYFKIQALGTEFAEVIVNSATRSTSYVGLHQGKTVLWPDFLLSVSTVALVSNSSQEIKRKPFEHASSVKIDFSVMKPVFVKEEWLMVQLLDSDYNITGMGWVRWKKEDQLLISYSLLS